MLDEQQLISACYGYRDRSIAHERDGQTYLGYTAKRLGVDKDYLYTQIKRKGVSLINSKEKVLHYHRTSMVSAKSILESGYLLNREHLKKRGIEVSSGSSSKNVQFTVDEYDKNGELAIEGFSNNLKVGAVNSGIVFVMGPNLLEEESYDCLQRFPTVEKASIDDTCVCIMAEGEESLKEIQSFLKSKGKNIPVILQKNFNREEILGSLEGGKENKGIKLSRSCKEAYESIDFDNLASNKDITDLVRAACHKDAPAEKVSKLRSYLHKQVQSGANIYATQAQIMKETRRSPASVFKGGGKIGLDSSQPETEQDKLKELARIDTYIGRLVSESPFEDMFGQLEEMERLKAFKNSRESVGVYSQSDYLEDKICQIKNGVESICERFSPEVLSEVAESKKVVENESLLVEQGVKEQSSLIFGSVNNTTKAINDLRTIASRQQSMQNEENISHGRSH